MTGSDPAKVADRKAAFAGNDAASSLGTVG